MALVSLEGSGMVGIPGFSKRLFETLSAESINIIMITQASSEHSICLGVQPRTPQQQKMLSMNISHLRLHLIKFIPHVSNPIWSILLWLVMKEHQGISGKLFSSLGANNINIRAIAQGASERNISIIIDQKCTKSPEYVA